ncbi:MAG: hypothetical protein JOZ54_25575 [Acidobacteria bacterium]|nr:hypothetical protein [Acidobacteriota bacterium]
MNDLTFEFEWADPLGARGPELRATWARFAIRIDQRYASRVFDQNVKTVRESVYLPLYPIAEWVASNWWRLLFEIESSERAADPSYERRHDFRWAREGYSVPPLSFTAVGNVLQLQWMPEILSLHQLEFLETGSAYVSLGTAQQSLRAFVTAVTERLVACDISDTYLQQEWRVVANTDAEEAEFCVAAATLGFDPYDLEEAVAASIVAVAESLPTNIRREFFIVASRENLREQSAVIKDGIEQLRENRADLRSLRYFRDSIPPASANGLAPWEDGYDAARALRSDLKAGVRPIQSFDDLADILGVGHSQFLAAIVDQPLAGRAYEAIVATNHLEGPVFRTNPRHDTAKRFHVCRGLYEYLSGNDDGPWLVTTGLSDRQKRNRAFAAEFLAPSAGIRERVRSRVIPGSEVEELAKHYGVSTDAIVHQLRNHRIASIAW